MELKPSNINAKSLFPNEPLEDEDDDSWQVSYLDIITIILGFLIILLSASQIVKPEFSSLSTVFGGSSDKTEFITTPIDDIQDDLVELLRPQIEQGRLELYRDLNDIRVRFKSDDFYTSGSADLQGGAKDLLNYIIRAFQQTTYNDFNIDVEGHTDNVPISSASFPSNWELSTTRASNVVKYFSQMGLEEGRLKASGFADSRPLIEFDSYGNPFAASKEKNRRVVLRLYYTSEGLQKKATEEVLATNDSLPPAQEAEMNEPEPNSKAAQIAQEIKAISSSNQNTQQPTKEEPILIPTPDTTPKNTPKPVSSTNLASIPSFLDASTPCEFSVQLGDFQSLSSGFQVADNAKNKTGLEFEVISNTERYSVRSKPLSSFSEALATQKNISSKLSDESIGIIHQCYGTGEKIPHSLQYQIQFGAFQSQENALSYTVRILDEFQIQTYMNRFSSTYYVVAGPFQNRETVLNQLQNFKEKGVQEKIFIKPIPESMEEYKYAYQLQIEKYSSLNEAQSASKEVLNSLGISSTVASLKDGSFILLTKRSSDWDQTTSLFERLKNSSLGLSPVIFYLEYI